MDRIPQHWVKAEETVHQAVGSGELEIDAEGRVWRVGVRRGDSWNCGHRIVPCERRRAERVTTGRYLQVRLMIGGKRSNALAHRLVWFHFNGPIPDGMTVNHRNGIRDDNRPSNLALATPSEQVRHAHRGGLRDQTGERNPGVKLTDNEVAQIRLAYEQGGHTMSDLARRFGVSVQAVSKIIRGQRRRKQGGPTQAKDQRHCASERDPVSGRFTGKKRAGRQLDGRTWDEMPA